MKRVLTDEFKITFGKDELITALQLVRRELSELRYLRDTTTVHRARIDKLREMESKIVLAYNTSGTRLVAEDDDKWDWRVAPPR